MNLVVISPRIRVEKQIRVEKLINYVSKLIGYLLAIFAKYFHNLDFGNDWL